MGQKLNIAVVASHTCGTTNVYAVESKTKEEAQAEYWNDPGSDEVVIDVFSFEDQCRDGAFEILKALAFSEAGRTVVDDLLTAVYNCGVEAGQKSK